MHYLYGSKRNVARRLRATFSSEQQLLSYVRWATLEDHSQQGDEAGQHRGKFEQGSPLAGYDAWEESTELLTDDDPNEVPHNPTPSML